jgi:hypothetical protein
LYKFIIVCFSPERVNPQSRNSIPKVTALWLRTEKEAYPRLCGFNLEKIVCIYPAVTVNARVFG